MCNCTCHHILISQVQHYILVPSSFQYHKPNVTCLHYHISCKLGNNTFLPNENNNSVSCLIKNAYEAD